MARQADAPARQLFRALVALSVILNGMAITPAIADSASAMHVNHHGQDGPDEPEQRQEPSGEPSTPMDSDCCGGEACGCGCAAPAVVAPRPYVGLRHWTGSQPDSATPTTFHPLDTPGAPFRPPA